MPHLGSANGCRMHQCQTQNTASFSQPTRCPPVLSFCSCSTNTGSNTNANKSATFRSKAFDIHFNVNLQLYHLPCYLLIAVSLTPPCDLFSFYFVARGDGCWFFDRYIRHNANNSRLTNTQQPNSTAQQPPLVELVAIDVFSHNR